MPESKKHPKSADAPEIVDWAERLRASMNAESAESDKPAVSVPPVAPIPDEEDDLAALLRAQLARQTVDSPVTVELPDTSEFEMTEKSKTSADDEEDCDEEPSLDEDAPVDNDEPLDEDEPMDDEENPEEEPVSDGDEENAELLEELLQLEFTEEPPPVLDLTDHDAPGVLRRTPRRLEGKLPADSPSFAHDRMDDAHLNGRSAALAGDVTTSSSPKSRMQELCEENTRLLDEEERRRAAAASNIYAGDGNRIEPPESSVTAETPVPEKAAPRIRRSRTAVIGYDPLQIGHDTRKHQGNSTAKNRATPPEVSAPVPNRDYTSAMPDTDPATVRRRDSALLTELGYAAELPHAEDRRAAESAHAEAELTDCDPRDIDPYAAPTVHTNADHMDAARAVADRRRDRRARLLRLICAAIGTFLALVWDILPALLHIIPGNGKIADTLSGGLYPAVGLIGTVMFLVPFFPRLWQGTVGLLRLAPSRYSVTVMMLTVNGLYTALAWGVSVAADISLPLMCCLPLLCLTVATLSEMLDADGEWDAWAVASAGRPLYVLTDEESPAASQWQSQIPSDPDRPAPLSARRTVSVDHLLARMGRYNPYMARLNILMPAALGAAILALGASLLTGGDLLTDGAPIFTAVFSATLPASYLLAMSLPLHLSNRRMAERGCAVIGTATPNFAASDREQTVLIPDRDILIATRRKEILLRAEDNDLPAAHWRRLSNRLFHLLNMPMAIERPFEDDGSADALAHLHAEIIEQDTHFLKVHLIDDDPAGSAGIEVMMGSHEALARRGVRLPRRSMESAYRKSEDSHVLYLAFDGYFRIAYSAEYRPHEAFAATAEALRSLHAHPVMVTYDPMVTKDLLAAPRFAALRNMQLTRPNYVDIPRRHCSADVLATGGRRELVYPMAACRAMRRAYAVSHFLTWAGLAAVTVAALILILSGYGVWINVLTLFGVQVLLSAPAILPAFGIIRRETLLLAPPKRSSEKPESKSNAAHPPVPEASHPQKKVTTASDTPASPHNDQTQ